MSKTAISYLSLDGLSPVFPAQGVFSKRMCVNGVYLSVGAWFRLVFKLAAVTVVAFEVCFFSVATIGIGGIRSTDVSDAEIIRAQNPVRLVSPDWVSPRGDLFAWLEAETRARFVFVVLLWAIAGTYVTARHFAVFGRKR